MDHPIDIWRVQQFLHVHEATLNYICKRYICTCALHICTLCDTSNIHSEAKWFSKLRDHYYPGILLLKYF